MVRWLCVTNSFLIETVLVQFIYAFWRFTNYYRNFHFLYLQMSRCCRTLRSTKRQERQHKRPYSTQTDRSILLGKRDKSHQTGPCPLQDQHQGVTKQDLGPGRSGMCLSNINGKLCHRRWFQWQYAWRTVWLRSSHTITLI